MGAGPVCRLLRRGCGQRSAPPTTAIRSPRPRRCTTSINSRQRLSAAEKARLTSAQADSADLIAARAYLERVPRERGVRPICRMRANVCAGSTRTLRPARTHRVHRRARRGAVFRRVVRRCGDRVRVGPRQRRPAYAPSSRERVLDWWASALDRDALAAVRFERQSVYQRIRERMRDELATQPASATAAYWLAAAARAARRSSGRVGCGGGRLGAGAAGHRPRRGASRRSRSADGSRDRPRAREDARATGGEPQTRMGQVQGTVGELISCPPRARQTSRGGIR